MSDKEVNFSVDFQIEKSLGGFVTGEYQRSRKFRFSGVNQPNFGKLYDFEISVTYDSNGGTFIMTHKEAIGPLHVVDGKTAIRLMDDAGGVLLEIPSNIFRACGYHEIATKVSVTTAIAENFASLQFVVDGYARRC